MVTIKGNKPISIISKNSHTQKLPRLNPTYKHHYGRTLPRLIVILLQKHLAQYNKFGVVRNFFFLLLSLSSKPLAEYSFTSALNGIETNRLNLTETMLRKCVFRISKITAQNCTIRHDVVVVA